MFSFFGKVTCTTLVHVCLCAECKVHVLEVPFSSIQKWHKQIIYVLFSRITLQVQFLMFNILIGTARITQRRVSRKG